MNSKKDKKVTLYENKRIQNKNLAFDFVAHNATAGLEKLFT